MFFGTHSLTLRLPPSTETFKSRSICHTLCADWLALHVIFGDCNPPEMFYHTVSPIYYAFTHQMFATDDFIPGRLICLTSELHLFHVCTGVT